MGSAGLKDDIQFRSFAGPALMAPTQTIRTEDGRTLRVAEGGDSGGWPLIAHHGTPACGNLYPAHDRYALEHGIRLIGYDRPGYGGSVRSLGRRVADARGDVLAIADHLELARFSVWGHSGGGPHAIACAATLPDRVASAAASGSCAPFEAGGLDWIAGMGEGNIQEFRASLEGPEALERFLQPEWNAIREEEDELPPELRSLLSPEDFELLTRELGKYLHSNSRFAVEHAPDGWIDDDLAFVTDWGFDLADIRVPTSIWHGRLDRFVPYSHGVWLSQHIPQSEFRLFDQETHLTLFERKFPEITQWLRTHGQGL